MIMPGRYSSTNWQLLSLEVFNPCPIGESPNSGNADEYRAEMNRVASATTSMVKKVQTIRVIQQRDSWVISSDPSIVILQVRREPRRNFERKRT
jgi:hypothetical protein